jgi:hypothetical protein
MSFIAAIAVEELTCEEHGVVVKKKIKPCPCCNKQPNLHVSRLGAPKQISCSQPGCVARGLRFLIDYWNDSNGNKRKFRIVSEAEQRKGDYVHIKQTQATD